MTVLAPSRGLDLVLAALVSGAALIGLFQTEAAPSPPPDLPAGSAAYRPDGGQSLGPAGQGLPNALTRLNLGHRVDFKTTPTFLLEALPGLGPKKAEQVRANGCLDRRARAALQNLVNETCARNNP
jgi:hypothetical protein